MGDPHDSQLFPFLKLLSARVWLNALSASARRLPIQRQSLFELIFFHYHVQI